MQKVKVMPSFLDSFAALYPQLQDIDFRTQAARLQVPVYLVEGVHEARGRVVPAREWFDALDAPTKAWVDVPDAGHRPNFEQPDQLRRGDAHGPRRDPGRRPVIEDAP